MSPWGYLLFTGWAVLAAALARGWALAGLFGIELAFGLGWSRRGLQLLRRPRLWSLILAGVAAGSLFLGEADVVWGGLSISREGFAAGLDMAGRALCLALAFSLGAASLSLSGVVALSGRLGLPGLGFALALAVNGLGTLDEMARAALGTIRLRGGLRRPPVALRLFLVTTVANALRYGDEVTSAAALRGFDPAHGLPVSLPLRWGDAALLAALVGCAVLLFGVCS